MPSFLCRLSNNFTHPEGCEVLRSACLYVCLSVCPLAYLKIIHVKAHEIFCRLHGRGSVPSDDNAIMLCRPTSGFVDVVTFAHNWPNTDTGLQRRKWRIIRRDSPGGAAKSRTRGRSLLSPIALFTKRSSTPRNLKHRNN